MYIIRTLVTNVSETVLFIYVIVGMVTVVTTIRRGYSNIILSGFFAIGTCAVTAKFTFTVYDARSVRLTNLSGHACGSRKPSSQSSCPITQTVVRSYPSTTCGDFNASTYRVGLSSFGTFIYSNFPTVPTGA